MTNRMYRTLIASVGAAALILAANQTFAEPGTAHAGKIVQTHPTFRPTVARAFGHHRGNTAGIFWPGDYGYAPTNSEPPAEVTPPPSGDVHYTYTYDVPWDWAHRYPPSMTAVPSEPAVKPYVPGCQGQAVTVPGADGKDQTVNIVRCY
jgi:hypothetical protein